MFRKKSKEAGGRRSFEIDHAISVGKKVWRDQLNLMQVIGDLPTILDNDVRELDEIIQSFKDNGGQIRFNDETLTWTCSYRKVNVKIVFDHTHKKKFSSFTDENAGKTPKEVIKTIGAVISAHHEISKRLFARRLIKEMISYFEDAAAKDSIEEIIEDFKDNAEVKFNAINGNHRIFDINIEDLLRGR
ncbi:MAG: hypothetical protein FWD92_00030 [Methanomassiliicoccaceae archaeon]|nr:hypothetical protein [Methanomassiliicoccaceae archaeon]